MVLGINAGPDDLAVLTGFIDAFQLTFPILPDLQDVYQTYRQPGPSTPFPLDYVVDQDGRVAYLATEYEPERMVEVIESLLDPETAVGDLPAAPAIQLEAAPNPFNPATEIRFRLERPGPVTLDVVDPRGRLVRRLLDEQRPAGDHRVAWRGRDDQGRKVASGAYLAVLAAAGERAVVKLTLVE